MYSQETTTSSKNYQDHSASLMKDFEISSSPVLTLVNIFMCIVSTVNNADILFMINILNLHDGKLIAN